MAEYRATAEDEGRAEARGRQVRRHHGLSTGRRTPRQGGRDAALLLPTANGMVQARVGQKLVKRNILRVFYGDRFHFCDATFS